MQAKGMLASVRPRDVAGKTRHSIAAEELAELVAVDAKIKRATAELKSIVLARGSDGIYHQLIADQQRPGAAKREAAPAIGASEDQPRKEPPKRPVDNRREPD